MAETARSWALIGTAELHDALGAAEKNAPAQKTGSLRAMEKSGIPAL
jgi:hypothetical protein